MTVQNYFDITIDLLKTQGDAFHPAKTLLDIFDKTELTFFYFEEPSPGTEKGQLLDTYETRADFEKSFRKNHPHVVGYDTLLPNFRRTMHLHICISTVTTDFGTFIIFSDFGRTDLLGILFSKNTLKEKRDKMMAHKMVVESLGDKIRYDYTLNEKIFINGQLIN